MSYGLGIDVGTTYTAAAVERDGHVQAFPLETYQIAVPSVVFASAGEVLFGAPAARRGAVDPDGLAREFKRRLGDSVPIILSGSPYHADRLVALMANWVVGTVTERVGAAPTSVAVTHPANWTEYQLGLLKHALDDVGMADSVLISEPAAAAWDYAATSVLDPGALVLVYDLGGGTFDVALLRLGEEGFEHQIEPMGIERLGGIDFDEAVFQHVLRTVPTDVVKAAHSQPEAVAAVANLKRQCVEAKETLSSNVAADIPVMLPGHTASVRVTRREFEEMIRPMVLQTLELVDRTLEKAKIEPASLSAALLVGGSSRIPLIPQMVAERGLPVRIDAHPKLVVAMGAARRAAALQDQQHRTHDEIVAHGRFARLRRRGGERPASPAPAPVVAEPPVGATALAHGPEPVIADDERVDEPTAAISPSVLDVEQRADVDASHLNAVATPDADRRRSTWRRRAPWIVAAAACGVILATIAVVAGGDQQGSGTVADGTVAESVSRGSVVTGGVTPRDTTLSTPSTVAPTTIATSLTTARSTTTTPASTVPAGFKRAEFPGLGVEFAVPDSWRVVDPAALDVSDPDWAAALADETGMDEGFLRDTVGRLDPQVGHLVPYVFSDDRNDPFVPNINVDIAYQESAGSPLPPLPTEEQLGAILVDASAQPLPITLSGPVSGRDDMVFARYTVPRPDGPPLDGNLLVVRLPDRIVFSHVRTHDPNETTAISDQIVSTIGPLS